MRLVLKILAAVIAIVLVWVGSVFAISELGGEVVTLSRIESDNSVKKIRIWIVDDNNKSYIEHGDEASYWMEMAKQGTVISLERGGVERRYLARADSDSHDMYHQLRREKYNHADALLEYISFGAMSTENCHGIPVILIETRI